MRHRTWSTRNDYERKINYDWPIETVFLKSDNIEIMQSKAASKIRDEFFQYFCVKYLESIQVMTVIYFAVNGIEKLYTKFIKKQIYNEVVYIKNLLSI